MIHPASRPPARGRRQRGVSLIDAMIAIAILSFGLIGMTRMQGRMVSAATDSQMRTVAVQLADELLDLANAPCYTLPASGSCSSSTATGRLTDWAGRVLTTMPGTGVTRAVTLDAAAGRLTVSIGWTSRETADARLMNVVTDIRQ